MALDAAQVPAHRIGRPPAVPVGDRFDDAGVLYSRSFDMERFWALTMILFAAAMLLSAAVELFEKRIEYYAGAR